MAQRKKRIYAAIEKMEPQDDGTLKVWGYASSGAKDDDGETITPDAMKAALPDYMKFGAVREMHQPSAAGTAIEAHVEDDTGKTWFGAHVVDPVAVKKVETGVYKGFSIGGKVTERDKLNKAVIKGINLIEVSLVDRPCNPEATFVLAKAARTPEDEVEELAELLDAGTVTPGQLLELVAKMQQPAEGTGASEAPPQGGVPSTEPVATTEPEPVVKAADPVQKGMYTLSQLAGLLDAIAWMCQDVKYEAEYEGDGSGLPAALVAWLKQGVKIMNDMAVEESAELIAALTAKKAAAATTLNKAADTNGIVPTPDTEAIQKVVSAAIAPLNESLEKLGKENSDLKARVEEMSKRAAPGKALLKSLAKGQDVLEDTTTTPETAPPEGSPERATYEMRKVLAQGGVRLS